MTSNLHKPKVPTETMYPEVTVMSRIWQVFFRDLFERVGKDEELTNTELKELVGPLTELSPSLIVATDANGDFISVEDLTDWILPTARITNTDSPYTALSTDVIIYGNTDGGSITVNMLAGSDSKGRYKFINTGSNGNTLTPTPSGTEKLFGDAAVFDMRESEIIDIDFEPTEGWW